MIPSPEFRLQFLAKLQRLFSEGEFTATYKFALLMAMTELAVEWHYAFESRVAIGGVRERNGDGGR